MDTAVELILKAFVNYGPAAARAVMAILGKKEITVDDWEKLFATTEKTYDDYVKPK